MPGVNAHLDILPLITAKFWKNQNTGRSRDAQTDSTGLYVLLEQNQTEVYPKSNRLTGRITTFPK